MYDRFLFVGLGGSGGKTLRFLKDQIRRWMKSYGVRGEVPAGWQFLHIDTPPNPDGDELNHLVPQLGPAEYLGLTGPGEQFAGVQAILDGAPAGSEQLRTWRVNPDGLGIPIQKGAGQYRAVGATLSLAKLDSMFKRIQTSLNMLDQADTHVDMSRVWGEANPGSSVGGGKKGQPYVVVVSSLAGGTGAGLLGTVCDLLRASRPALGDNLFGVLYTSEVFDSLAGPMSGGVHANALAALSETMNGHWWRGAPIQDRLLAGAGAASPIDRSGPSYPFLVGLTNSEGVNFGTYDKLFEATGRALLAWVIAEAGQANFMAYTIGNWKSYAEDNQGDKVLVDRGLTEERGNPPFSALGFARLSLGTDHFARYAVHRLTTDVFHHLVDHHVESEEARLTKQQTGEAAPDKLAELLAANHAEWFRRQTGIEEQVDNDDSSYDIGLLRKSLTPPDTQKEELRKRYYEDLVTATGVRHDDTKRSASEWRALIDDAAEYGLEALRDAARRIVDERSRLWVKDVERTVIEAACVAIVRHGLQVTQRLCSDAADYLRGQVIDDLSQNVVPEVRRWWESWDEYVDDSGIQSAAGKIGSDNQNLGDYVSDLVYYRMFLVDWLVATRATELAAELASKVLDPLADALRGARLKLESARAEFPDWARWERSEVPEECGPPKDEFALIEHTRYYETFQDLLAETFPDARQRRLRERLINGAHGDTPPIVTETPWLPSTSFADGSASSLGVAVNLSSDRLREVAEAWMEEPNSPFGAFVGLGLRDAFTETASNSNPVVTDWQDHLRRHFTTQIIPAIDAAKPLVHFHPGLEPLVGQVGSDEVKLHFSPLPFDGLPIEIELTEILVEQGLGRDEANKLFNADPNAQHISITAQLLAPQPVLAIRSLLNPIAADWARAKNAGQGAIDKFWHYRRSSVLQRFVPCPQEHLRAMVRGWFTGRLLGLIRIDDDGAVTVAREAKPPAAFPFPSLSKANDVRDPMAVVLESLSLAYVEAARVGGLESLRAYDRLLELGCSGAPSGGVKDYERLNRYLSDWVKSGTQRREALEPLHAHLKKAPTEGDGEVLRREALVKVFAAARRDWQDAFRKCEQRWTTYPDYHSKAPLWTGLWPLIGEELDRLRDAAGGHVADDGGLY